MKKSTLGFLNEKIIEYGLDFSDTNILHWLYSFSISGKMDSINIDGREYYWLHIRGMIMDIPQLAGDMNRLGDAKYMLSLKKVVARKLKRLVNLGLLFHHHSNIKGTQKGSFPFYAFTEKFYELRADLVTPESPPCNLGVTTYTPGSYHKDNILDNKLNNNIYKEKIYKKESETVKDNVIDLNAKKTKQEKKIYGEHKIVALTDKEYERLKKDIPDLEGWIWRVGDYCERKLKRYDDYNRTIRNWYRRDKEAKGFIKSKDTKATSRTKESKSIYDYDSLEDIRAAIYGTANDG